MEIRHYEFAAMTPDLPAVEIAIVQKTNDFRRANQLAALRRNPLLDQAAKAYARYLARTGKFSHTADGRSHSQRIKAAGYKYCITAENLALNGDTRGFRSKQLAQGAIAGWKNSLGHRKNMLRKHVTEIGVGVAKAPNEHRYLSVQLFGRPAALKYSFRIENRSPAPMLYSFDGRKGELPKRVIATHTSCQPALLKFHSISVPGKRQKTDQLFETRDGDVFVLQASSAGVRVIHKPKLR